MADKCTPIQSITYVGRRQSVANDPLDIVPVDNSAIVENVNAQAAQETRRSAILPPQDEHSAKVPPNERRGLFSRLLIAEEVINAEKQPRRKKWCLTFIISMCGAIGPFASGITLPLLTPIAESLDSSAFVSSLSIALYMLAMGIFPLWWSSLSETVGRRSVMIVSNFLLSLFSVLCAVSTSMPMFLAFRFLSGSAASAALAIGAGVIADLWQPRERGNAMGFFFLGPLCGPLVAPILGGGLAARFGWRSALWFLVIYSGILVLLVILCLPETSQLVRREDSPGIGSQRQPLLCQIRKFTLEPLKMLTYLRFPAITLTIYLHSVSFAALYVFNISIQNLFSHEPYNFPSWLVGFVYAPSSLGFVLASVFGGDWSDRIMQREAIKANRLDENGKPINIPEDRLKENAWISVIMYAMSLIWYGWSAGKGVMWVGVLIPPFFFGIGSLLLVSMTLTMLTEFMPTRSASGVALNNFVRNIFSFIGALVAIPWINAIGNGWVMTILGGWALTTLISVRLIQKHGKKWRKDIDQHFKEKAGHNQV